MVVGVIVNSTVKTLNRAFDYLVPEELEGAVKIGDRVSIPFGNSKRSKEGYVVEIKDSSEFANKYIQSIEKDGLTEDRMKLAILMSRMYFCNIFDCIKLMLPPGTVTQIEENRVKEKTGNFVYLAKEIDDIDEDIDNGLVKSSKQLRIIEFLKENDGVYIGDLEMYTEDRKSVV